MRHNSRFLTDILSPTGYGNVAADARIKRCDTGAHLYSSFIWTRNVAGSHKQNLVAIGLLYGFWKGIQNTGEHKHDVKIQGFRVSLLVPQGYSVDSISILVLYPLIRHLKKKKG